MSEPPAPLRPGDTFGRYTIEALLGEGGMGAVYRAVDTKLERRVALKVLRSQDGADPQARAEGAERLLREARAAAAIEHANAVAIHDVGEVGDARYIAMELVVGRSLRSYVGDTGVPVATRVRWLMDVARALGAAHARGLVHRDVKPDNVMVREDGAVKVLDFGIAWVQQGAAPERGSLPGDVPAWYVTLARGPILGTPRYMAPEQLRGEAVDGRTDQFAWGVMAYELLAGAPPWRGSSVSLTVLADVLENDPAPLRSVAASVDARIERVVLRALAKAPADRFATMGEVVAALEDAGRARGKLRALWTSGVVAGVVAATALAFGLRARPAPPPATPATATIPASSTPSADTAAEPPHIVLHLDASQGVTTSDGRVTRWADLSGNDTDAVPGKKAPTLAPGVANGLPAVHFENGALLRIDDAQALHLGKGDFTVALVTRTQRAPSTAKTLDYGITNAYGCLFSKTLPPYPYPGVALMANYPRPQPGTRVGAQTQYGHFVLTTSEHLDDDTFRLVEAHREGGALEIRVNGAVESRLEGADDDVSAEGEPLVLGAHETSSGIIQRLRGDLAEVVVIRGGIAPERLAAMERDLRAKYGLVRTP